MANSKRDKAVARFRLGLPIKRKELLSIKKSDDRHNFRDKDNANKYKMRKYPLLILIVLLAFGCKTPKPITNTIYKTKYEKEIVRDTIIQVQIKPMYVERETRDTNSILSTSNASSQAIISKGVLFHSLEQKGFVIAPIKYIDKVTIDTIYKDEVRIVEVEKELNWWEQLFIGVGKLFALILILLVIYGVFKIFK